jgi:hypothetical protein
MNNKKIKLAVASAVLSAASIANAGIIIPAGDWTLDVNGNVNAFATWHNADKDKGGKVVGGIAEREDVTGEGSTQSINTGLLPSWLGFTGTTRQNDVDVSFTISLQQSASDEAVTGDILMGHQRQAFVTFGDKSWGSVKLGKDLGLFAGQAILNDMTLLGVGGGGAGTSGARTTLGGIGSGYIYPAWKGQIAYTTPNMNGFTATIAITNPNQGFFGNASTTTTTTTTVTAATSSSGTGSFTSTATTGVELYQDRFGVEGQLMYEWTGDVAGKVWASGASYDVTLSTNANTTSATDDSYTASVYDVGAAISAGNLGLVGYYYNGEGVGTTMMGGFTEFNGAYNNGTEFKKRDSDGGYVQATYVIPTGTKLGLAYGISKLDEASGETDADLVESNERWTVGAYHPLTKHLNLVAEYNKITSEGQSSAYENENDTFSLGAILFF